MYWFRYIIFKVPPKNIKGNPRTEQHIKVFLNFNTLPDLNCWIGNWAT